MVSSDTGSSGRDALPVASSQPQRVSENEAGVGRWTGRAVFVSASPSPGPQSPPGATSRSGPVSQSRSGTAGSPIEITSSPSASSSSSASASPPSTALPRPRAVPAYSSPISRTAYTPPRAFFPPSPARQMSSPAASSIIHPFFTRTFGRSKSTPVPHTPPPPASQRPRFVANYSSTSESQASTATDANSTFGSGPRQRIDGPAERLSQPSPSVRGGAEGAKAVGSAQASGKERWQPKGKGKGKAREALTDREVEELVTQVESIDLTGKFRPNPKDVQRGEGHGGKGKGITNGGERHAWAGPKSGDQSKGKFTGSRIPSGEGPPPSTLASGSSAGALARYGRPIPTKPAAPVQRLSASKSGAAPNGPGPGSTSSAKPALAVRKSAIPAAIYPKTAGPSKPSTAKPPYKSKSAAAASTSDPADYFAYTDYSPTPEVVYTTDFTEANALLSRLEGNVLGLDLEWPMAGFYKMPGGGPKKPIGMTWNTATNKWDFGQGRTALVQVCDEKLIILIHLKEGNNMTLPQKVIDIMQDPMVYKCGVQIQGDALKLVRDFPDVFPEGLNGLLELTKVARRVDPIKTGPGNALISLANLTKFYTGKPLDKEAKVRKSNWFFDLDDKQIQYAANDAYAGLQVYLSLKRMAEENDISLDLDKCSNRLKPDGSSRHSPTYAFPLALPTGPPPTLATGTGAGPSTSTDMRLAPGQFKYPPPRQQNILNQFRLGSTLRDFAIQANIQPATAEGYILDALAVLADDTLTPEEMGRLVPQIKDIRIRRKFKVLLVRLRRGAGEEVSDSDASAVESSSDGGQADDPVMRVEADSEVADLGLGLSGVKLGSAPEAPLEVTAGDQVEVANVADHGWTAEELEAVAMMSDSEDEGGLGRKI